MTLNIDRLHKATELLFNGNYRYRQEGTTTAYLHLMLGELELGDPNNKYLYLAHNLAYAGEVCTTFKQLVYQSEAILTNPVVYFDHTHIEFLSGLRFTFGGFSQRKSLLRGNAFQRVFLDIDEPFRSAVESNGELHEFLMDIFPTLATNNGDIV